MKTPLLLIELATSDVPGQPLLGTSSWMLSAVSSYHDRQIYCFLPPDATKHENLGVICQDILPQEGNKFDLELGVTLPDLFPNLDGCPEYTLRVSLPDRGIATLCFSNVMARARFEKQGSPFHALISRRDLPAMRAGAIEFVPQNASVELLRTFATTRYVINGATAEEALESQLEESIHDFIQRLNHVLKVLPFADPGATLVYSVVYSRATFECFYFLIRGRSETQFGQGRVSAHLGPTILRPPTLPRSCVSELCRYLEGEATVDDIAALLHSARVFLDGGVVEYVLLLSVIAAEVATQRFVHKSILAAGASKTWLSKLEKDLTYAVMANLILYTITPKGKKPDPNVVGAMNRARKLRNEYMHNGLLRIDAKEIATVYESTKKYVEYLREVELCLTEGGNERPTYADKHDFENAIADKVISDCTEAIRLRPDCVQAYASRGIAYGKKGEHDRAIADYTEAIRLKPDFAAAYYGRGVTYENKGDYDKAIADHTEAIRLQPDFAEAYENRGTAYGKKGDHDKAIADCSEAIRLKPEFAEAYVNRGVAYGRMGGCDKGIADLTEAIRLRPDFAEAYANRGVFYEKTGDFERAIADHTAAIGLDPRDATSYNGLAWLLATCPEEHLRDGKRAVEHAARACELTQWKDSECTDTLAAAYAEAGQFEKAVEFQEKALGMATREDDTEDRRKRLNLYREGKPYREARSK